MGQEAARGVTSGGHQGTNGERSWAGLKRDPRAIAAMAFAGFGLLYALVNAASLIDQRRALGQPIAEWAAYTLEGTSFAAWLALLPIVLAVAARLSPRPPWQAALGHAVGCVILSLAHTSLMSALRVGAFGIAGLEYAPSDPWPERLLFEARKDVITYALIVAAYLLARRLVAVPATPQPVPGDEALIEVNDGSRRVMLRPDEIDWVSAAGNYVELHGSFGSELVRRTMASIEATLAPHGFVRTHRSRLVRQAAIKAIEIRQSGDFTITLRSGAVLAGSRRYRQNLRKAEPAPALEQAVSSE